MIVKGPHVDLRLSIAGRTFINSDGKRNMPSGEIFTGPVEDSVNGWVRFNYPAIRQGREVSGVEFEFKDGKVVAARAEKHERGIPAQPFRQRRRRYLGEFAVGTNPPGSSASPRAFSSTRRSAAPCTWPWARAIPRRAAATIPASTGTSSATCATTAKSWSTANYSTKTVNSKFRGHAMNVRDMSSPAITVGPETSVIEVARIMRERKISGLPVVDGGGRLLGTITELDMIARNAPVEEPRYLTILSGYIPVNPEKYRQYKEQLRLALATTAGELMEGGCGGLRHCVTPDTPVDEALRIMLDPENFMLPVLDNNVVVGVTRTDMVRMIESLEGQDALLHGPRASNNRASHRWIDETSMIKTEKS
ncbi:MAG: aminopeptidase [Caldilineaceae bacterium]